MLLFSACDFDILNTNAPTVDRLTDEPTRDVLASAASGIFSNAFNDVSTEIAYYALYGREGYNLQGNDPRETGEQIRGPQDPTGRNSAIWTGQYSAIRNINTFLEALETVTGVSEEEASAAAGFAKTLKAWHYHRLAVRTGELGIPLDVDRAITDEPAPFVSFEAAMEMVSSLLDEALQDLQAGDAFPFSMGPGFDGFGTPETFAEFNRALAAKVLVHRATFVGCDACWAEANTAMAASFVTSSGLPGSLANGVYYGYTGQAGEPSNPVTQPLGSNQHWVHPSIVTGAQQQADGSSDRRLTEKVTDAGRTRALNDLVATHKPTLYNQPSDPATPNPGAHIAWIDNEELLLLRAEIRWNDGDKAGALADIDRIRQHAGGLEPTTLTASSSDDDFVDELLYNRLYSLMWAQGTRWIDARRYDRLDDLPVDRSGDSLFPNMLVPANECTARELPVPCEPTIN